MSSYRVVRSAPDGVNAVVTTRLPTSNADGPRAPGGRASRSASRVRDLREPGLAGTTIIAGAAIAVIVWLGFVVTVEIGDLVRETGPFASGQVPVRRPRSAVGGRLWDAVHTQVAGTKPSHLRDRSEGCVPRGPEATKDKAPS